MKINVDRLCELAGLNSAGTQTLNEASNRSMHDEKYLSDEAEFRYGKGQLAEMSDAYEAEEDNANELIEVDEEMLVQELRRIGNLIFSNMLFFKMVEIIGIL